ncbi:MAG: CPBP family intramembrane metalloprotease [Ruminococcaceae bacterium]|nr:CPBP family intramembrane metalloprotease [Oscillospiraceae bacterium]
MQYPYYNGNPYSGNFLDMNAFVANRSREKTEIRKLGNCVGLAVVLYLVLQYAYSFVMALLGLSELYAGSELFRKGAEVLIIILSILPAFMIFGKKMKKISGVAEPLALSKPKSGFLTFLAFLAGMASCMVANYVTVIFSVIMSIFGYALSSPDVGLPRSAAGITVTVVQIVFVAALVEELSLRGYVMGNLRKYGSTFAIFCSALIFALMHGNLVQAPFALVSGFAIGFFAIRTESIWTGILIHAGNNLFSVVISYVGEFFGDNVLNAVYSATVLFFLVAGGICFVFFLRLTKNTQKRESSMLTNGEKIRAFLTSPAIIAVIVIMLIITLQYIAPIEQAVS